MEKLPTINRKQSDHERCEKMEVEFIGGPSDGMRLYLDVVRGEAPGYIRVLEAGYTAPEEKEVETEESLTV